ncbi:MAG: MSCRAMM family adhesin SdrC [Caldilineaceae bacterium]|nr:MSCRAMM family adhesin SdrC [Caldilineaceae bacterium]HRJ42943.1 SdrD B-like domain-containing protein [Caldilineaceae bacterium]
MNNFSSLSTLALVLLLFVSLAAPLAAVAPPNERATVSLTGEVYMDGNFNTIREPQESGIANSRILLLAADGSFIAETTSDSEGYYAFDNLDLAAYQLQISAPAGYIVTGNGLVYVAAQDVSAPLLISTSLLRGIFIPLVSR